MKVIKGDIRKYLTRFVEYVEKLTALDLTRSLKMCNLYKAAIVTVINRNYCVTPEHIADSFGMHKNSIIYIKHRAKYALEQDGVDGDEIRAVVAHVAELLQDYEGDHQVIERF